MREMLCRIKFPSPHPVLASSGCCAQASKKGKNTNTVTDPKTNNNMLPMPLEYVQRSNNNGDFIPEFPSVIDDVQRQTTVPFPPFVLEFRLVVVGQEGLCHNESSRESNKQRRQQGAEISQQQHQTTNDEHDNNNNNNDNNDNNTNNNTNGDRLKIALLLTLPYRPPTEHHSQKLSIMTNGRGANAVSFLGDPRPYLPPSLSFHRNPERPQQRFPTLQRLRGVNGSMPRRGLLLIPLRPLFRFIQNKKPSTTNQKY